ncbi:MAG TPA: hypothetical protein VF163_10355, partial [Micromonosporaceae bacterium]
YALLRGRPPRWREGYNPTLASLVDMFAERVPDLPNVTPELTALLRQGMANEPAARPSAAELRDALSGVHRDPDPTTVFRPVSPDDFATTQTLSSGPPRPRAAADPRFGPGPAEAAGADEPTQPSLGDSGTWPGQASGTGEPPLDGPTVARRQRGWWPRRSHEPGPASR